MPLRDYQQCVINTLRIGYRNHHMRQIVCLPTGAGKSHIAAAMIRSATDKKKKSLFIVDRIVLIEQSVKHLAAVGLKVGILQGNNTRLDDSDNVTVASIQTIANRKIPLADFVIIDEIHLLRKAHINLIESWRNTPIIGLTATPLNPKLADYFTNLVNPVSIQQLIDDGYLVPVRAYSPGQAAMQKALLAVKARMGDFVKHELAQAINRRVLIGDIISTWLKLADNRLTLCFAIDVKHSKNITKNFLKAGIAAAHIDGKTKPHDRAIMIRDFKAGIIRVLCSCDVLSIGFDVPETACLILARPTLSESLYMQQIGRGLRPANNKPDCLVLDHAGNMVRFGDPANFIVPALGSVINNAGNKKKQVMAICKICDAVLIPGTLICPHCGDIRARRLNRIAYIDDDLTPYTPEHQKQQTATPISIDNTIPEQISWLQAFKWYAEKHAMKTGWIYHVFKRRFDEPPPIPFYKVEPVYPTTPQANWIKYEFIRYSHHKKKTLPTKCPGCESNDLVLTQGKPPHKAAIECAACGRWLQWLPKDYRPPHKG